MSQSHDYARYLLRYDGGAYILIRVDANFVITGRRVLRSRAETAPLVGTWVRVPTVSDFWNLAISVHVQANFIG